jgi:DNA-binding NarL/FixJ family response regulator
MGKRDKNNTRTVPAVAIVDEDPDLISLVRDVAKGGHFDALEAFDSSSAVLERLPRSKPDVMLIDIRSPKMRAFESMQRLKTLLPDLAIVAMTSYPDTYSFIRALMAGAGGFLEKPFTPDELTAAITDAVNGKFALGKTAAPHLHRFFKHLRHATQRFGLTEREEEILACVFAGLLNKEIADTLSIGSATVHTHLHRIFTKLGVHSRKEVITKYLSPC